MDVQWALFSAPWVAIFLSAQLFSGNKANIHPSLCPSDQVYHRAVCSGATPLGLHGKLLPAFPLDQQPYPQVARQYLENDHLGSDGQNQVDSLI